MEEAAVHIHWLYNENVYENVNENEGIYVSIRTFMYTYMCFR